MKLAHYSTVAENQKIDRSAGVIFGVSVITLGRAQGHNMQIDGDTLAQMLAVASSHKDGIKVKFGNDHKAGVDDTIGVLKTFRIDGDQLRADFHALKSTPKFDQIFEMAEKLPNEFGFSAVFSGEHEEKDKTKLARCSEIYSVDLVSDPAANPNGLFSKKTEEDGVALDADGKTHKESCTCKECMKKMSDKSKTKSMSDILTPEFVAQLKKLLPDTTTELAAKIASLEKTAAQGTALAKKSEIDSLVAEAGRAGQVIPLENDDLYTIKDGIVTIGTEPEKLKKMLAKLPKSQIQLSRTPTHVPPTDTEGKVIFDRRTPEGRAKVIEFCRQKQAENAPLLGSEIKRTNQPFFANQ